MGVVVFTSTTGGSDLLPSGAKSVKAKAGRDIPLVMVTNADGSEGIEGIPAKILKEDMRQAIRDLKDKLKTVAVVKEEEQPESPTEEPGNTEMGLFAESQQWSNSDGKPITAAIRTVENGQVVFVLEDGREVAYPLTKLSAESQTQIREIQSKAGSTAE